MIKVIAFDYGGVVKINEQDLIKDISDYLKISKEDYLREYFKVNNMFNIEGRGFEEVTSLLVSKFDDSKETKEHILKLLKENKGKYHLNKELIKTIEELKNKGYKIVLLSNNSLELRQKLAKDNILDLFDEIIISAEVGYQKPQPEIFDILFKKLGVEPNEVIFIDDSLRSLEGADKIGYAPVLYKDNETLKVDLSNLLQIEL
jgi:epoxide hydrolase-like predicted phosphatase